MDSGGVGLFTLLSAVGTAAHEAIWCGGLVPRDLEACPIDMSPHLCHEPARPSRPLAELVFSDDRRLFAASAVGAAYVLDTVHTCCLAAGGAPNKDKLKLFRVALVDGALCYRWGLVQTPH